MKIHTKSATNEEQEEYNLLNCFHNFFQKKMSCCVIPSSYVAPKIKTLLGLKQPAELMMIIKILELNKQGRKGS